MKRTSLRGLERMLDDLRERAGPPSRNGELRQVLPDLLAWFTADGDEDEEIANSDALGDLLSCWDIVDRGGVKFLGKERCDLTLPELERAFDAGVEVPLTCGWPMQFDTPETWRERIAMFERVREHLEAATPRAHPEAIDWSYR